MTRYFFYSVMLAVSAMLLAACSSGGSSAPPPANVTAVAGDSSVTLTWDATPGVQYWLFFAPVAGVTTQNCYAIPGCQVMVNAVSPVVISNPINGGLTGFTTNGLVTGLTNGTTYSFSLNGRTGGGPGGAGSPSVSAIPRLAGTSWTAGSGIGATNDMHGITNGLVTIAGVNKNVLVAVGGNSSLYSSQDGINWIAPASGVLPTGNLNAATALGTTFLVAGTGGLILTSPDTVTWTKQTTGVTNDLYALASNGAGTYVAVGANGTILYSLINGGTSWLVATSGTSQPLYGVTYANGLYVAAGAAGTLLTSPNGVTWTAVTVPTTADLKSVAFGGATLSVGVLSGSNTFVVIGAAGTLITSTDASASVAGTWTLQPAIASSPDLNAITYGHQFIAVGNAGAIYTSLDGISWQAQSSGTGAALYAIARRPFDYSAVGGAGLSLFSK